MPLPHCLCKAKTGFIAGKKHYKSIVINKGMGLAFPN
jgi:hypothetical protein